jgi:hypothetical protein
VRRAFDEMGEAAEARLFLLRTHDPEAHGPPVAGRLSVEERGRFWVGTQSRLQFRVEAFLLAFVRVLPRLPLVAFAKRPAGLMRPLAASFGARAMLTRLQMLPGRRGVNRIV